MTDRREMRLARRADTEKMAPERTRVLERTRESFLSADKKKTVGPARPEVELGKELFENMANQE